MPVKHKGERASRGNKGKTTDAISGKRLSNKPSKSDLEKLKK